MITERWLNDDFYGDWMVIEWWLNDDFMVLQWWYNGDWRRLNGDFMVIECCFYGDWIVILWWLSRDIHDDVYGYL